MLNPVSARLRQDCEDNGSGRQKYGQTNPTDKNEFNPSLMTVAKFQVYDSGLQLDDALCNCIRLLSHLADQI